jgi:DMSO/TMAO reductase YedYZ molybdopterin-dependent catalytic subunit
MMTSSVVSRKLMLAGVSVVVITALVAAARSEQEPELPSKSALPSGSGVLLEVGGEVAQPLSLSAAEFAKLPRQSVRAKAHDEALAQFEGVPVSEILSRAGVPSGKELRGKAIALYLVVEASDGYRAVFGLPELDPLFTDRVILLADRRDGKPLSAHDGPLQIIVPGEKRHARWVRQVVRFRIGRV